MSEQENSGHSGGESHSSEHHHHSSGSSRSSHKHHRKKRLKIPRNALIIALAAVVFIGLFVLLVRYLDQQDADELQVYSEAAGTDTAGRETAGEAGLTPYDPNVMDAWQNSLLQLQAKADIVFIGDSLIRQGDFDQYFPGKTVCNLGLNGDTLVGMANRAGMIRSVSPGKVFVMGGINSLRKARFDEAVQEYGRLLSRLSEVCAGEAEVYILSVLPVSDEVYVSTDGDPDVIRNFNEKIRSMAEEQNFTYVDLYSLFATEDGYIRQELTDGGVHLTGEGYSVFAEAIRPYID